MLNYQRVSFCSHQTKRLHTDVNQRSSTHVLSVLIHTPWIFRGFSHFAKAGTAMSPAARAVASASLIARQPSGIQRLSSASLGMLAAVRCCDAIPLDIPKLCPVHVGQCCYVTKNLDDLMPSCLKFWVNPWDVDGICGVFFCPSLISQVSVHCQQKRSFFS